MIADNHRLNSLTHEGRKLADDIATLLRAWPELGTSLWTAGQYYHEGMLAQERIHHLIGSQSVLRQLLAALTMYDEKDVREDRALRFSVSEPSTAEEVSL